MGFVTLEAIDGESAPRLFQLSDSVLTLKRLFSVFGMALRLPGGAAGAEWCSADNPNWVRVLTDGDVAAMFAVATAIKPKNVKVRVPVEPREAAIPPILEQSPSLTSSEPSATTPAADAFVGWENVLQFYVDGAEVCLPSPDIRMTLAQFLHSVDKAFPAPCEPGKCAGGCTVVVSRWDASASKAVYKPVNTCTRPVATAADAHIMTKRSCDSGWTLNMFSLLASNPTLTIKDVEAMLGTSVNDVSAVEAVKEETHELVPKYPPHLRPAGCFGECRTCSHKDVCHPVVDLEDIGKASASPAPVPSSDSCCSSHEESTAAGCCGGSKAKEGKGECDTHRPLLLPTPLPLPSSLCSPSFSPKRFTGAGGEIWFAPKTLEELRLLQTTLPAGAAVQYVFGTFGGTEVGSAQVFIDMTAVRGATGATPTTA